MTTTPLMPHAPAAVSPGLSRRWERERRAIADALRSERIKLATVRSNRVLFGLTVVVDALAAYATSKLVTDEVLTVSQVFVYPAVFTAVFAAIAGVLAITSEAQHGTLAATFIAQPRRRYVILAKAILTAGVGIAFGTAGMLAAALGAATGGLALGRPSDLALTGGYALLYTGAAATFGLGLGLLVHHSAGAVSGLLVWWFVAENLLRTFTPPTIGRYLPFDAGYRMLGVGSDFDTPEILAATLHRSQYALVFTAYSLLTLVAGTVVLSRRDVA
ncbi:hypothetical protein KSP35_20375 [Aquihabitans sp. G128]|uniref:hypothetical protein n=1 Tax=Aquihabitans sp. G128 TaxID=2849779 RepID=UPI001C2118E6|nr:hypothetical protein [Aquihabitans sp. G128]QXC60650.1 hypothetical protein KSP35_20375 [Aquihabitans sp. G128]